MNSKSKPTQLSGAQLAKLKKLMGSVHKLAGQHIDQKVGRKGARNVGESGTSSACAKPSHFHSKADGKADSKTKSDTNSLRTQQATRQVLQTVCRRLYDLGFQLEDIGNLQRRHVEHLVKDWHVNGVTPKTINNYLSIVRKLCGWMGKHSLVPASDALVFFLPEVAHSLLKVSTIASNSKSWSEQGIDVIEKLLQADAVCIRFGAMLRLGLAFGLRRKEQLRCIPSQIDGIDRLMLRGSVSKSGRDRDIEITSPFQRSCLEHAKSIARPGQPLGWPGMTYMQSLNHYNYLMGKKMGITGANADCVGHGLRAEFAENMALRLGFNPPTLGGAVDQLPGETIRQIQMRMTRAMGHNRISTMGAYCGSVRRRPQSMGQKICSWSLEGGLIASLHINPTPAMNSEEEFVPLTAVQQDRAALHVQVDSDGQSQPVGIWRIDGDQAYLLEGVNVLSAMQKQALRDKLRIVLGKLGWINQQ